MVRAVNNGLVGVSERIDKVFIKVVVGLSLGKDFGNRYLVLGKKLMKFLTREICDVFGDKLEINVLGELIKGLEKRLTETKDYLVLAGILDVHLAVVKKTNRVVNTDNVKKIFGVIEACLPKQLEIRV